MLCYLDSPWYRRHYWYEISQILLKCRYEGTMRLHDIFVTQIGGARLARSGFPAYHLTLCNSWYSISRKEATRHLLIDTEQPQNELL